MTDLTIKDVRAKFPQYDDMSDQQLADAIHQKYYADMDPTEFYGKIGFDQQPAPKPAAAPAAGPEEFATQAQGLSFPAPPAPKPDPRATPMQPPMLAPPSSMPQVSQPPMQPPMPMSPADVLLGALTGGQGQVAPPPPNGLVSALLGPQLADDAKAGRGFGRSAYLDGLVDAPRIPGADTMGTGPQRAQAAPAQPPQGQGTGQSRVGQAFDQGEAQAITSGKEGSRRLAAAMEEGPFGRAFYKLRQKLGVETDTPEARAAEMRNKPKGAIEQEAQARLDDLAASGFEVMSWKDIRGIASAGRFIVENTAMALPYMAAGMASGPTQPQLMMPLLAGEVFAELDEKLPDLPEQQKANVAAGAGVAMWAFETIGLGAVVGRMLPSEIATRALRGELADILTKRGLKRSAARMIEAGIVEGSTEAIQEGIIVGSTATQGGEYTRTEVTDRLANAFAAGSGAGLAIRGGTEAATLGGRNEEVAAPPQAAPAVPQAAPEQPDPLVNAMTPEGPAPDLAATMMPDQPPPAPQSPAPPPPESGVRQGDAVGQPEGGRIEILDETETINGESVPTGRKVRVNLDTGEVSPVEPEADQREAVQSQPPEGEPVVGSGQAPAAGDAPATQPSNVEFIGNEGVMQIGTEPEVMQYKAGGDAEGVTDRLKGVTEWKPERAGMAIIYEYEDGRRVIADGHQRLGLAKRLVGEGKPVQMTALVMRQADGITPQEARTTAALKNIAEGSGTAIDAAKVLRDTDQTPEQLGLPPNSAVVRDAMGMRSLSPDAFGMVVNGVSSERDGGIVGRVVTDKGAQANILGLLARLQKDRPITAFQAEQIARQAAADTVTETQDSLFGPEADTQNLYLERAKVLESAIRLARDEERAFKNVVQNADRLSAAGNQLDAEGNQTKVDSATAMRDYLQREANTKGAISDALSKAARALKGGTTAQGATRGFLDAVESELAARSGDGAGGDQAGQGAGRQGEGETDAEIAPEGRDENAAAGDMFGGLPDDQPAKGMTDRQRAEMEAQAQQSKMRKEDGNTGDSGPLFDTQGDMLDQAAPAEPEPDTGTAGTFVKRSQREDNADFTDRSADLPDRIDPEALADEARRLTLEPGTRDDIEYLMMIDADGQIVAYGSGHKSGTGAAGAFDLFADPEERIIAHHNHPGSTNFSPDDFSLMLMPGTDIVYAHGHDGTTYAGRATPTGRAAWGGHSSEWVRQAAISKDLKTAKKNVWNKSQATFYKMITDGDLPVDTLQPARDLADALSMAMQEAKLIEFDVTGPGAARSDRDANLFFSTPELKKLYDDLVRSLKKRAADATPEAQHDRPATGTSAPGRMAGLLGIPESGADITGSPDAADAPDAQAGRPEDDSPEEGGIEVTPPPGADTATDGDFEGALDDMFGGADPEPKAAPAAKSKGKSATKPAKKPAAKPKRSKAAIAKDMKSILKGLKEDDLFGDTPQPSRSMTQRERAELEARAKQSKMRTNKPQQDAGPLFGDQDDLFGGLGEAKPETPAFKRWFGDSKVVDEDGDPLILWHGTARHRHDEDFDTFKGMVWASEGSMLPFDYAAMRANRIGAEQAQERLIDLYMRVERPFDADLGLPKTVTAPEMLNAMVEQAEDQGRRMSEADLARLSQISDTINRARRREESGPHYGRHDFWYTPSDYFGRDGAEAIAEAFKITGFDGIKMIEGGEQTWGAFSPNQVKSPQNRGTFDPSDPQIFREDAPQTLVDQIDVLENVVPGWTSAPGGMLSNPNTRGGIIDKAMGTDGKWFVVFGNGWEAIDGFKTRGEAVAEYARSMKAGTDPTKYRQLVPLFIEALDGLDVTAQGRRETFGTMMRPLVDAGLTREDVTALRPYFTRFLDDVESGRIDLQGDIADAPAPGDSLESPGGDTGAQDDLGGSDVSDAGGNDGQGTGTGSEGAVQGNGRPGAGASVPGSDAASVGGQGDSPGQGDGALPDGRPATDGDSPASRDSGEPGLRPDDAGADATRKEAADSPDRVSADPKSQPTDHHRDVAKAVPALRPEQVDDVVRIERRFYQPEPGKKTGFGMLITNGTGTGKTMTGLGAARREVNRGAKAILVVVKTQGEVNNWVQHGPLVDLDVSPLADTQDTGGDRPVVVTTYKNLTDNEALADREWDMVIADESHMLMQNKAGNETTVLRNLRAITNKPSHLFARELMKRREQIARTKKIQSEAQRAEQMRAIYGEARDAAKKAEGSARRSRVIFMSATPFARDTSVDYGEGYLFDYPEDATKEGSRQSGRNWFMVQNFGYRIRYHKLTKPEAAVDRGVFHREFYERMKREGALWGRKLDVPTDYDRKFVATESDLGTKIDKALDYLRKQESAARAAEMKVREKQDRGEVNEANAIARGKALGEAQTWEALSKRIYRNFSYLKRMQLLEAIKAKEAMPDIKKHLAMGRKVVVFHDYNVGGATSPFAIEGQSADEQALIDRMNRDLPWLKDLDFGALAPPKDQVMAAFGDRAREYNGTISKKERQASVDAFNTDGSGVDVLVTQSDAGSGGISLHDTTGGHQRALINLGMPTKPTTTLQAEGRTRRVGVVSDAIYRYYTIGTTWEREAFARRIAEQSGEVENLALGNDARAIREAFTDAYAAAQRNAPSSNDGKGGREADLVDHNTSDFEKAKTHYYGRPKMKGKRDQRDGIDFFPTPEPLALKMVEWAGVRPYEKVLEPSAGDGAIARYFPAHADRTIVEPSHDLSSRAELLAPGSRVRNERFEDLPIVNKYDAVVMNPPFGRGGKTAFEHVEKAMQHTRPGGRVVALVPRGPAADKAMDRMLERLGKAALEWNLTADLIMPPVAFERAGTSVASHVLIFDRVMDIERFGSPVERDMTTAGTIKDFFDNIENIEAPARPEAMGPTGVEADMDAQDAEAASQIDPPAVEGGTVDAFDVFEFKNTQTGEMMYGAQVKERLGDRYKAVAALAKEHGGYYSKYQNSAAGAKRGFLFPSDTARRAWMEDLGKPQMRGLEESAYHGTPYDFDRFDLGKIGTGDVQSVVVAVRETREGRFHYDLSWNVADQAQPKKADGDFAEKRIFPVRNQPDPALNMGFLAEKVNAGRATPNTTAMDFDAVAAMLPTLRAELDRLNLKRVNLGMDTPGVGRQGVMVSQGPGQIDILIGQALNPMATLYHEAIHAMKAMNLFTPAEWKALEVKAAREWVEKYDIPARYPDLTPTEQIEEAIAEAFAEAAATRKAPKGSAIVTAFNKIARLLKALRTAVMGPGRQSAEDVFGKVLAGQIGARDAGNTGFNVTMREQRMRLARRKTAQQRAHNATAMGSNGGGAYIPDRRIWEELTLANRGIFERLRGGGSAAYDHIDKARIKIQDRFLPVLRAQAAIERQTGQPLPESHNAYLTEETFSGKAGRRLDEIDHDYTKPIIDIMAGTKQQDMLDADYVGTWLYARHAKERNARIASLNPAMPDGGSGMTDAEADQILLAAAASPDADRLLQIGRLIDKLRKKTIDLRENAGLISAAEADLWRNQYKYYVPLKGFADTDHSEAMLDMTGIGRRFNTRGPESKMALGRRSEAFNPLQGALTQAQEVAIRAEKNRVGQALYKLAKDFPSKELWSVKTPKQKRYFNRTTGLVETRIEDPISLFMDPNELAVKIDGQERRILFHDPRLARAAGSVGADQMNGFIRIMSMASRWFSAVNTMLDPEFVIRNAFRDMTAAQINIRNFGGEDRNKIAKAMIKNWPKAFAGAYRGQENKTDTEWTKYYREFEESGAKVSFWRLEQPEAATDDMVRRVKLAGGNVAQRARRFVRISTRDNPLLGFVERTNLAVDNAIRLAAYVEARKMGWTKQQAASLSKNMTVNFNRRGEWGATINALYPFANAGIQGTQILLRAMSSKRMAKYGLGMVALGLILDMVNAGLSEEDEDGELAYDKIPTWKSQMNLTVMLGPDAGSAATIWLPYGYNVFPFMGQQASKVMRGVKKPEDAMKDFAIAMFGAFSPLGGGNLQSIITPTMLDPVNEMAMNKDWLGSPIRPEQAYSDYGPNAYKYFGGVSNVSRGIADFANRATGGTRAEPGFVDVSPEYLDHAFGFFTGGAGRFAGRTTDLMAKLLRGETEDIEGRDIPFYRSLQTTTGDWLDRDRYYRFRDQVREARNAVKTYDGMGVKVPDHIRRTERLYDTQLAAERTLRQLRESKRQIEARSDLSAAEISERRAAIDERMAKVYLQFNKVYTRVHGRQGE